MNIIIVYLVGVSVSLILHILSCVFNDKLASVIKPFLEKMEFEKTPNRHLLTWKDHWNDMKVQVFLSWIGVLFLLGFYVSAIIFSVYLMVKEEAKDVEKKK